MLRSHLQMFVIRFSNHLVGEGGFINIIGGLEKLSVRGAPTNFIQYFTIPILPSV